MQMSKAKSSGVRMVCSYCKAKFFLQDKEEHSCPKCKKTFKANTRRELLNIYSEDVVLAMSFEEENY